MRFVKVLLNMQLEGDAMSTNTNKHIIWPRDNYSLLNVTDVTHNTELHCWQNLMFFYLNCISINTLFNTVLYS